jgi:membrane protease YdiL (CAAX protease family)
VAIIVLVPWKLFKYKTTRDELGLRGLPTWTDILLSPVGLILALILGAIMQIILTAILPKGLIDWEQAQAIDFKNLYRFGDFAVAFLCLVVLAPVCEELMFRGWLYGKLRLRLPAVPAIIIVSLLFGIMHGQVNVAVTVFAMSVLMCIQRELTGTIWSGILLHMLKNAAAFYFLFVV